MTAPVFSESRLSAEQVLDVLEDSEHLHVVAPVDLVTECGLTRIPIGADVHETLPCLRQLTALLNGGDALSRAAIRVKAIGELKRIGVQAPASVVDAALQPHAPKGQASTCGKDPEPWPEAVNGARLLDDLCSLLNRYMVLPEYAPTVIALWTVHTYAIAAADYTPYLLINSPVRECGKSTQLELLSCLTYRAQLTGGITAAALYRRIDRTAPTVLLDELDTRLRSEGGENLRGVLNTGFHRSGKVTICVGDAHEDKDFKTFCAKALAGIGRPWDTVVSRSIPIRLERAPAARLAQLGKIRGDRIGAECEPYRRQAQRWATDVIEELRETEPAVPSELGARQADVWRPLFAIAEVAGGEWPERARRAALGIYGAEGDEADSSLLLLEDVRDLFASRGNPGALFSATIVEELSTLEHRPWPEYRHGQPLTKNAMAKIFGRFGIKPKQVREGTHSSDPQQRGYRLEWLQSAFSSYLPPHPPEKVSHASHSEADVTDVTEKGGGVGQYELDERTALESGL